MTVRILYPKHFLSVYVSPNPVRRHSNMPALNARECRKRAVTSAPNRVRRYYATGQQEIIRTFGAGYNMRIVLKSNLKFEKKNLKFEKYLICG